jgi:hypothetical protein
LLSFVDLAGNCDMILQYRQLVRLIVSSESEVLIMRFSKLAIWAVVLVCAGLLFGSCVVVPAHPAHGYRQVQGGIEMVYDSGMGLYIVTGYPNNFFYSGRYYRYREPNWEISVNINGPWRSESFQSLPRGLKERGEFKQPPPGRDKGGSVEPPGHGRGNEKK